jgi:hypothetical protein
LTQVKDGPLACRIDAAQCDLGNPVVSSKGMQKAEVIMMELSEQDAAILEQSATEATTRLTKANKHALDFMMGAQKVLFEEMVFASNEMLERGRTEMHLLSEFVSKMAGSHSVKDLKTMGQECAQHQLDFVRRDSERLFKHAERMLETTSKLFNNGRES